MMGSIDWIPIADMPDALKDGREVLVGWWDRNPGGTDNPRPDEWTATVAIWPRYHGATPGWQLAQVGSYAEDGDLYGDPTHFAEINPPL